MFTEQISSSNQSQINTDTDGDGILDDFDLNFLIVYIILRILFSIND